MKSQYEYNDVLASNVTTGYKQSSKHATVIIITTIICGIARK